MTWWKRTLTALTALVCFSAAWQATYAYGVPNNTIWGVLALVVVMTLSARYTAAGDL